jgi:hypothetical protein
MARAMRKAGVFSGKTLRLQNADVDLDHLIEEVHASRMNHYVTETLKSEEAAG